MWRSGGSGGQSHSNNPVPLQTGPAQPSRFLGRRQIGKEAPSAERRQSETADDATGAGHGPQGLEVPAGSVLAPWGCPGPDLPSRFRDTGLQPVGRLALRNRDEHRGWYAGWKSQTSLPWDRDGPGQGSGTVTGRDEHLWRPAAGRRPRGTGAIRTKSGEGWRRAGDPGSAGMARDRRFRPAERAGAQVPSAVRMLVVMRTSSHDDQTRLQGRSVEPAIIRRRGTPGSAIRGAEHSAGWFLVGGRQRGRRLGRTGGTGF